MFSSKVSMHGYMNILGEHEGQISTFQITFTKFLWNQFIYYFAIHSLTGGAKFDKNYATNDHSPILTLNLTHKIIRFQQSD